MSSLNGKESKDNSIHPFLKKDPKPTRARLVSLLDPLGRKRYSEVERFLATVQGATSGLFYYGTNWGWAVRYLLGTKNTLCTLHLLRNQFEASVQLGKEMDAKLKLATLDTELKRRLSRSKLSGGVKVVRMPIKNDHDYAGFKTLIGVRAETLREKKPAKPTKAELAKAAKIELVKSGKSIPVKAPPPKKSEPIKKPALKKVAIKGNRTSKAAPKSR